MKYMLQNEINRQLIKTINTEVGTHEINLKYFESDVRTLNGFQKIVVTINLPDTG